MLNFTADILLLLAVQAPGAPGAPAGHWINPRGTVIVEIAPCGGEAICGWVRWASNKAVADARAGGTDPLVGTELFRDFVAKRDGRWKGRLFVPDLARTHSAELRLMDARRLKVSGCMAGRLLCKSQVWTRTDPPDRSGATLPTVRGAAQ